VPQQRKLVTVLFADISGFTAMFESMNQDLVNDVITSLWSRVDKAIQDQGVALTNISMMWLWLCMEYQLSMRTIRSGYSFGVTNPDRDHEWKKELSERLPNYQHQIKIFSCVLE